MREDSEPVEAVQFEGETENYELSETHVTFVAESNKNRIRVKFPREDVKFFNGVLLALIE